MAEPPLADAVEDSSQQLERLIDHSASHAVPAGVARTRNGRTRRAHTLARDCHHWDNNGLAAEPYSPVCVALSSRTYERADLFISIDLHPLHSSINAVLYRSRSAL